MEVLRVGGHDRVASTNRSFDHGDVDDVIVVGLAGQHADVPCLLLAKRLDFAVEVALPEGCGVRHSDHFGAAYASW
jgi:hypothetical protein